jgi:hypothetical protein
MEKNATSLKYDRIAIHSSIHPSIVDHEDSGGGEREDIGYLSMSSSILGTSSGILNGFETTSSYYSHKHTPCQPILLFFLSCMNY